MIPVHVPRGIVCRGELIIEAHTIQNHEKYMQGIMCKRESIKTYSSHHYIKVNNKGIMNCISNN